VLSLKLDRAADDVTGQTVVDPKGYLTSLATVKLNRCVIVDIPFLLLFFL
jgi:hypothetical protein